MGDQGIVASRVGEDSRGLEALRRMEELGLDIDHVQTDRNHATGTVNVELDAKGQARFEIAQPVAWDFLEWTQDWQKLAEEADAVCFGSLAQRSEESRTTIGNFLTRRRQRHVESLRRQSAAVLLLARNSFGLDEAGGHRQAQR